MSSISILGCGWLGWPLAIQLRKKGWQVKGATTTVDKLELLEKENIQPFLINIYKRESLSADFFQSDILFLNIPPGRRNANVLTEFPQAISRLLPLINQQTKVLLISSTSVYGDTQGMISESSLKAPVTNSGQAMDRVEESLLAALDTRLTILRPSGLVGGNRHPIHQLSGRKGLKNGDAPVNLIHRQDVLLVVREILSQAAWGEIFNLSADVHPSKSEYYGWAAEQLGLVAPEYERGGAGGKWINSQKVKAKLNIQFQFPDPNDFLNS